MSSKYQFSIFQPDELAAGLIGFNDVVTVIVDSGEPTGEPGEFEEYIKRCLSDWYDGARVCGLG